MQLKPWKTAIVIGLFLLSVYVYSQLGLPTTGGPYSVGRTTWNWVDASRPEALTENPDDLREISIMAWYPAEPGTGKQASYVPHLSALSEALIQSGEMRWWEVLGLRLIRSESRLNAIPLNDGSSFPVVILSPGNGTNIELYSSLAGEIASHGYIVLGINHPYDVPAVRLSNGEVAPYNKDQWLLDVESHQAYISERIQVRTADVLYVFDRLDDLNSTGHFAGLLNLDSVAAAGHSLGGITASEACKADARLRACINLDGLQRGGPFSMDERAIPPEQPFLFLTKESVLHPNLLERFESMSESYWVVVHGASHESFTDGPLLRSMLLPVPGQAERWMSLVQKYSLAFLNYTLKGHPGSLISTTADGKDVSVKVFPDR